MKFKITLLLSIIAVSFFLACSGGEDGGCAKVREAGYVNTTPTTIDIQFDGSANSFFVEWGPTGFTQGSGTSITTSDMYVHVQNLTPSTTYDFYITSICSDTERSGAYKISSVTTDPSECMGNTTVSFSQNTASTLYLEYAYPSGIAYDYEVQYGLQGFALGTGATVVTTSSNYQTLSGLSAGTTYDFYVRAKCYNGEWAPYKKYTYVTMTSCPAPANLNSWLVSGSCNSGTATRGFSWSYPFGTPANYEFSMITTVGAPASSGNITVTSNTSIAFSGMFCIWKGFYVRANCGDGEYSDWAGPFYW